jgi:ABC-2 type transport system permease protein
MFKALTRKMLRIAGMEFKLTARNKAFVIVTIIGPFLIVAMSVLPSLLAMTESSSMDEVMIAVAGGSEPISRAVSDALEPTPIRVVDAGTDETVLQRAISDEEIDGYLILPASLDDNHARFVSGGAPSFAIVGTLESVIGRAMVTLRLADAGLDPAQVAELSRRPSLEVTRYHSDRGEEAGQDPATLIFTVLAFTMMLYMTILLYGQAIGRSVLNEKLSKTVEIMLSSVNPRELLVGKILGKAAASMLQYAIWIVMAMVFLNIVGPLLNVEINLAGGTSTYIYLVGFFLLAFVLYSTVYAALGAASEDESHLGQLSWPVILFLVIPMIMIGTMASNPDSTIPRILSIFPLTAPIVMFQRLMVGNPATWEVILSVALLLVSIGAIAMLAAKIFRIGILMTGKRFTLREIMRWVRYRE